MTSGLRAQIVQRHQRRPAAAPSRRADGRRLLSAAGVEFDRETVRLRQQMAGVLEQDDAVIGQRDAAGGARHQPGAEIVFEQPDVAPECRGQHFEPLRRAAEMQLLGRGHETAKLVQFHLGPPCARLYQIFV